jgi:hypothetical protein
MVDVARSLRLVSIGAGVARCEGGGNCVEAERAMADAARAGISAILTVQAAPANA